MTRIIAGDARGVSLAVPKSGTRPTSDRVREAIFSALDARVDLDGGSVLDLYAGSGALGLEAVSRGAAAAVLVERSPKAVVLLKKNAAAVSAAAGIRARAHAPRLGVETAAVAAYLQRARGGFDVVFCDPPYDLGEEDVARDLELVAPLLAPHGVVVLERSSRSPAPRLPEALVVDRVKAYGETTIHYLEVAEAE